VATAEAPDSIFGPLVSAVDIELAVAGVLQRWIDTYLLKAERHHGLEDRFLVRPRSIRISSEADKLPEDQLPALLVMSPGTVEDAPVMNGESDYTAVWELSISGVVAARGTPNGYSLAMQYARLWAMAIRGVVVQQQDERGVFAWWDWQRERYDLIDADGERTIAAGRVSVQVQTYQTIRRWAGPIEPAVPPAPPGDPGPDPEWPVVETIEVSPPILVPMKEMP